MFKHLIESSSHKEDYARRGSFFFATAAVYAMLLMAAGVASIYAYDAHLESQSVDVAEIVFLPPDLTPKFDIEKRKTSAPKASTNSGNINKPATAPVLYDNPSNPRNIPKDVGIVGTNIPPALPNSRIGPFMNDPGGIGPVGPSSGGGNGRGDLTVGSIVKVPFDDTPPELPKLATKPAKETVKSLGVINAQALEKPVPPYPQIAKIAGISGTVTVQILLDETGKVISARATDGPPLLRAAAVQAAYRARFSPTLLSNKPVKASGVLTYNFILR